MSVGRQQPSTRMMELGVYEGGATVVAHDDGRVPASRAALNVGQIRGRTPYELDGVYADLTIILPQGGTYGTIAVDAIAFPCEVSEVDIVGIALMKAIDANAHPLVVQPDLVYDDGTLTIVVGDGVSGLPGGGIGAGGVNPNLVDALLGNGGRPAGLIVRCEADVGPPHVVIVAGTGHTSRDRANQRHSPY